MQVKKPDRAQDIRYLKGVGPKKAETLKEMGVSTVEDILYYLPRRYEDRSNFTLIKDLKVGEFQVIKGSVLASGVHRTKKGTNVFRMALGDKTGVIYCVWFNQPFLKKFFKTGQDIIVYGKVERYDKLQINHPEYEIVVEARSNCSINIGRIVPIYSLTGDISQRYVRLLTHEAIGSFAFSVKEALPANIRARNRLVDLRFAIQNIHYPASFENLERAYKRLVFEEFFILQLALALKKNDIKTSVGGIRHRLDARLIDSFKALFPFELTHAQLKVINEIQVDMASPKPMNRLLEGDVGSGKTAVAVYALLLTVQNGYQAAVMAPTEILARQHYINMSALLMPLGINVRLLVSGIKEAKKLEIKNEIEKGRVDIVIGTHALIWGDVDPSTQAPAGAGAFAQGSAPRDGVKGRVPGLSGGLRFRKLGLAVIDEQHKFGVRQRQLLRKKGERPDVLVMTATPIPRTLALTVYGDLDISVIRELPKGRYPITTYCVEEDKRRSVYQFIREEIEKGRQAYVVYPRIWPTRKTCEAAERRPGRSDGGLKAATEMYNKLRGEVFPDLKLGLLHGRMNTGEKETVMKKFRDKKVDILVSTTIIEVGIDIPNASCMVIENAERFGLSQLHQLRGRIGRGEYLSCCILLGLPKTESAKKRFDTMADTQDGFRVAERDLELRGPGEFFGTRQHGLPELRFGNILRDFEIMEQARAEAFRLVREDPYLRAPRNSVIKDILKKRFVEKLDLINVG